jgi:hypothetical protein
LTWTEIDSRLGTGPFGAIAPSPRLPQAIYAATHGGLYQSVDGGRGWTHVDTTPRQVNVVAPPAEDVPRALFGGTRPQAIRVRALAVDPQAPNILYAATQRGVFRTNDGAERA